MPTAKQVADDLAVGFGEDKTPLPELADTAVPSELQAKLENLVRRRCAVALQIKKLEEQKDEFDARVEKILRRTKVLRARIAGSPTRIVVSGHTKLDEDKLIERGVSPKLIAKCKVYVPHREYLRIDLPKEE